jgi:hypothetical protein
MSKTLIRRLFAVIVLSFAALAMAVQAGVLPNGGHRTFVVLPDGPHRTVVTVTPDGGHRT